jgi:N-carbamoylputrescine amidase
MQADQKILCGWVQAASKHFKAENLAFYESEVRQLAKAGAEVVLLPELFLSDYFAQQEEARFFEEAISVDGAEIESLCNLAKSESIILCVPFFEKRTAGLYHNSCLVIDEHGEILDLYRKMHIPDDPGFFEKYYFTPGDAGWKVVKTSKLNLGLLICWDQWFPEAARLTAMAGADCLYYPTAIAWDVKEPKELYEDQLESWKVMLRSHSISNGCFTVAVNRTGQEEDLKFWGNSLAVNPAGRVITPLSQEKQSQIFEMNLGEIELQRRSWPFFRDRRVDAYQDLTKIWRS